mgnify:CR=1 FL=1|jgi:hypothetical protein
MSDETTQRVRALLTEYEGKYRRSAWRWKVGYRTLLVVSALFSTSAAVIGKLEHYKLDSGSDLAAMLAAAAAVITTLIAALDFEVNWRINRRSRHEVDVIALESEKSTADADKLLANLQEVVKRRNDDLNKQD